MATHQHLQYIRITLPSLYFLYEKAIVTFRLRPQNIISQILPLGNAGLIPPQAAWTIPCGGYWLRHECCKKSPCDSYCLLLHGTGRQPLLDLLFRWPQAWNPYLGETIVTLCAFSSDGVVFGHSRLASYKWLLCKVWYLNQWLAYAVSSSDSSMVWSKKVRTACCVPPRDFAHDTWITTEISSAMVCTSYFSYGQACEVASVQKSKCAFLEFIDFLSFCQKRQSGLSKATWSNILKHASL